MLDSARNQVSESAEWVPLATRRPYLKYPTTIRVVSSTSTFTIFSDSI